MTFQEACQSGLPFIAQRGQWTYACVCHDGRVYSYCQEFQSAVDGGWTKEGFELLSSFLSDAVADITIVDWLEPDLSTQPSAVGAPTCACDLHTVLMRYGCQCAAAPSRQHREEAA